MKNSPLVLVLLLVLGLFSAGRAAATELDALGQGLGFLRLDTLADHEKTFHSPVGDTPALVLDLRGATTDEPSTVALLAALRHRSAGKGVCLILISPDTAPSLLAALAATPPGCLTVGRADGACHPDIAVTTTAEADSRARAAFTAGTPITTLLGTPADKPRFDEVELAKEHDAGKNQPAADAAAAKPAALKPASPKEPALVDAVLQRAVQIHRGLLALGKLGEPAPPAGAQKVSTPPATQH